MDGGSQVHANTSSGRAARHKSFDGGILKVRTVAAGVVGGKRVTVPIALRADGRTDVSGYGYI